MELFDTHFHFYGEVCPAEYVQTVETELARISGDPALRMGYAAMGGDFMESERAAIFAGAVPNAVFACGVHPHSAEAFLQEKPDFSCFRGHPKLAAVGEIGLDYYYDTSPREQQKQVLEYFLALAAQWELPVVIHIRDQEDCDGAYLDAYERLKDFAAAGGKMVIHCFSGTPEWAERFLSLGAYLGVTGMVTFRKGDNIRTLAQLIPADRLLLETDSPYLAPVPMRGNPNHPGWLWFVAKAVAECRGVTVNEILELTSQNARSFYSKGF